MVNNLPANAGEVGSTSVSGRSPRGGNGNPLQYSCLENPTDGSQNAGHDGYARNSNIMSLRTLGVKHLGLASRSAAHQFITNISF